MHPIGSIEHICRDTAMRQRVVGLAVQVQSRCVFRVRQFGAAALPPFAGNFRLCEGLALSLLAQYAPRR